jgi:hypothetical protein
MGYATILCIYQDGIDDADRSREQWHRISTALGEAVLQVCMGRPGPRGELDKEIAALSTSLEHIPDSADAPARRKKLELLREARKGPDIDSASVGNHANCVNRCDKVHSTWTGLYLWSGNCLRPLHELDADDLKTVEQLLLEELQRRGPAAV